MLAMNVMSVCRAQLICNLYFVCLRLHTATKEGPWKPLLPTACEAVLAPQPGLTFGENILPQPVVKFPTSHLPLTTPIALSRLLPKKDRLGCC